MRSYAGHAIQFVDSRLPASNAGRATAVHRDRGPRSGGRSFVALRTVFEVSTSGVDVHIIHVTRGGPAHPPVSCRDGAASFEIRCCSPTIWSSLNAMLSPSMLNSPSPPTSPLPKERSYHLKIHAQDENRFVIFAMTIVLSASQSHCSLQSQGLTVQRDHADDEPNRQHHHHKRVDFQSRRLVRVQPCDRIAVSTSSSLAHGRSISPS